MKALLVLDFINDIAHPDGKIAASASFIKEHNVIENVNKAIANARDHAMPIVFVKVGFNTDYAEIPQNSPIFSRVKELGALQLNTWGTEFISELDVRSHDLVIVKHRVSAFYGTSLDLFLRAKNINHLLIAGVSTDMAVQTTARDAHDRDYKITILKDACAASSLEIHETTLALLQRLQAR